MTSKEAAHYGPGMPNKHCSLCRYYVWGGRCEKVRGDIDPQKWCRFFRR